MSTGIGERFQEETKYVRGKLGSGYHLRGTRPEPVKIYPEASKVSLDPPTLEEGMPVWEAVSGRRSIRNFAREPLDPAELSQLLWAAQGITREAVNWGFRAAPSAGALYPVETYLSVQNVSDLEPGIYHYSSREHASRSVERRRFRRPPGRIRPGPGLPGRCGSCFLLDGRLRPVRLEIRGARLPLRLSRRRAHRPECRPRGGRPRAGVVPMAALYDDEINALLGVDGEEESILYLTAVGRPV